MAKKIAQNTKPFSFLDKNLIGTVQTPRVETYEEPIAVKPVIETAPKNNIESIPEIVRPSVVTNLEPIPTNKLPIEQVTTKTLKQLVEKFDHEKRILLTKKETLALDRVASNLARTFNTPVKTSHILRAAISLILNSETEFIQRAGEAGILTRPSNGDGAAVQQFEKQLANIMAKAILDSGGVR